MSATEFVRCIVLDASKTGSATNSARDRAGGQRVGHSTQSPTE